ncbi:MAG: serine/threonine protein kinase [Cellvibrionaceae bacterium]
MNAVSIPQQLPGYRITGTIGEGGMAVVYRGEQKSLGRSVAVKVLNRHMREHSQVAAAFDRESMIIARLSHPNIIQVYDRGVTDQGVPWFAMEYIKGLELGALIRKGILKLPQKYSIAVQICKALSYAHRNNVLHRDIKPCNVLVDRGGHAKVLDFGISQFYGSDESDSLDDGERKDVMGTWAYMAPELQAGGDATVSSDIYSLGLLLFEVFCGHLPSGKIGPKSFDQSLPLALVKAIVACVNEDPAKRPPAVNDLRVALLQISQGGHLSKGARQRAAGVMTERQKKSFALLDVIKEAEGFSSVYLFQEKSSNQQVIVKKLVENFAGYEPNQKLTHIEHHNIGRVFGVSKNDRIFIVVSEYQPGGSLQDRLARPMSEVEFADVADQIASGLAKAHDEGVLHGNLRPSNVMFSSDGRVKLVDIGLNEQHGAVLGDNYRPEGELVGISSDLYALGVVFYQMLVGELPQWKDGHLNVHRRFKRLSLPVQKLVAKLLLRSPDNRYHRVREVVNDIACLQDDVATQVFSAREPITQAFSPVTERFVQAAGANTSSLKKRLLWLVLVLLISGNLLAWQLFF